MRFAAEQVVMAGFIELTNAAVGRDTTSPFFRTSMELGLRGRLRALRQAQRGEPAKDALSAAFIASVAEKIRARPMTASELRRKAVFPLMVSLALFGLSAWWGDVIPAAAGLIFAGVILDAAWRGPHRRDRYLAAAAMNAHLLPMGLEPYHGAPLTAREQRRARWAGIVVLWLFGVGLIVILDRLNRPEASLAGNLTTAAVVSTAALALYVPLLRRAARRQRQREAGAR